MRYGRHGSFLLGTVRVPVVRGTEVLLPPGHHLVQDGNKAFSQGGEAVFHPGRDLGKHLPVEEPVRLQLPQLLGEGGLGDSRQTAAEFPEPLDPVKGNIPKDEQPGEDSWEGSGPGPPGR